MADPVLRLMELDARHTELLERLSALDSEVDAVLNDWMKTKETSTEQPVETVAEKVDAAA